GKLFHSSAAPTPRKALGNWNAISAPGPTPGKPGGLKQAKCPAPKPVLGGKILLKPPSPISRHTKTKQKDKQTLSFHSTPLICAQQKTKHPLKLQPPVVKPQKWTMLDEDKENMFPCNTVQDTFEDLWPAVERPSTYLQQLLDWRPSGLHPIFPTYTDAPDDPCCILSDDSDDDLDMLLRNDVVQLSSPVKPVCEVDMPSLDDILLQPAEDLFLYSPTLDHV
ncbi:hypothetical protein NP493_21g05042, partial [Ridgeia piscesae]